MKVFFLVPTLRVGKQCPNAPRSPNPSPPTQSVGAVGFHAEHGNQEYEIT